MSRPPNSPNADRAEQLLKGLLAFGAILEIGVGLGAVACPGLLLWLLLDAPPVDAGLLVTRLLGTALIALGLAWWFAWKKPGEPLARGSCFGFLVYNLGAGLWLMLQAATATDRAALLWTVGLFHAGLGLAFAAILLARFDNVRKSQTESRSS